MNKYKTMMMMMMMTSCNRHLRQHYHLVMLETEYHTTNSIISVV